MESQTAVVLLLLGDSGVGKTTFLSRISQGSTGHVGRPRATLLNDVGQPFLFDIKLFNRSYRFEFYDTASPSDWTTLAPNIVVLCYDISNRLSLISMQRTWIKAVKKHFTAEKDIPILVLGLKRDLRSETDPNGIIFPQEAYRSAQEMRCDKYMECSAVSGELFLEVFEDICRTAAMATTPERGLSEGGCRIM